MLHFIIGGVALAGIAWLVGTIGEKEEKAYHNWKNKHSEIEKSLAEHRKNIIQHLESSRECYDYHTLIDIHYSSHMIGNSAHSLLKDSKVSIRALNEMLKNAKEEKLRLEEYLQKEKKIRDSNQVSDINEKLRVVQSLRKGLFLERDKLQVQLDKFESERNKFNIETAKLRDTIRDYCGYKGREWYSRLEERKRQKR